MDKREVALKVAWSFLGLPYMWGGDDPIAGFDCSGFVIECLKSAGILPRRGDWAAQGIWDMFNKNLAVNTPGPGCLVFWESRGGRVIHVEMCIDDELAIGASGGGSENTTRGEAIKKNAYIKIRPFRGRANIKGYIDPFLERKDKKEV